MTQTQTVDLEEVKLKIYERLKPSGWADKFRTFVLSDDFTRILEQLLKETGEGKRFTPLVKNIFRAFELCPYSELKVMFLGRDPYPQPGVGNGIAFDCSLGGGYIQPSLRYIFQEVERTVYPGEPYVKDPDLSRWAKQGVLLTNTALTTTVGKVGTHYKLWQPFIAFMFDMLNAYNPGMIYVYTGKKAQEWKDAVSDRNYKILISHPASAAHKNSETWDCEDVFNKINKILMGNIGSKIEW